MTSNPGRPNDDGYPLVEAENPLYWQELNEMGKRGELPERIWPKRDRDDAWPNWKYFYEEAADILAAAPDPSRMAVGKTSGR